MPKYPILAIDPGIAKCGVAVLASDLGVLHRSIVPTADIAKRLLALMHQFSPKVIVLGKGTASQRVQEAIRQTGSDIPVELVDEEHTSELARKRYLAENPAKGLGKLIPLGMRIPDEPYDDLVAVILAERWLATLGGS